MEETGSTVLQVLLCCGAVNRGQREKVVGIINGRGSGTASPSRSRLTSYQFICSFIDACIQQTATVSLSCARHSVRLSGYKDEQAKFLRLKEINSLQEINI